METHAFQVGNVHTLQTRLLCPFFCQRHSVQAATRALLDVSLASREGQRLAVWECAEPHDLYQEEILEHVSAFLFPGVDAAGCGYLRLAGAVGNRWFNGVEARLPGGVRLPVRLVASVRLEMFLSPYGVGVLSLALEPDCHDLSLPEAIEFNYRLSQLRWDNAGAFHLPHPVEDAQRWERLSPEAQQAIPAAPDRQAPLGERLGRPGGTFTPRELTQELLRPLEAVQVRQVQDRLSVYTVARFGAEVDFARPEVRMACAPLLAALAQVEEATHAAAPADSPGVAQAILNRRHWAGVGLLGAVHLVADQEPPEPSFHAAVADQALPEHPFNAARVPRVFLKYFIPYLVALLQRHTLHRTVDEASEIVRSPRQDTPTRLAALRTHLLEFAVQGRFTQVSTREALHRYYRLCQEGLDVHPALDDARQAIAEIDAKHTVERQLSLAEDTAQNLHATKKVQEKMTENLVTVAQIQKKIEWIEIFLVSVYAAHLWHMFESHVYVEALRHHLLWFMPPESGRWDVLLVAVLALASAAFYLRPWRHGRH